jgi:NADH:ubiquinone oxidoreductase subunit H
MHKNKCNKKKYCNKCHRSIINIESLLSYIENSTFKTFKAPFDLPETEQELVERW